MPYNPGEKHKELGKATLIKQKQRKWPVERATERQKLLTTREHDLLVARDKLRMKRAFVAAMSETNTKRQEEIFTSAVRNIVFSKIRYFRKKGIPTRELEKKMSNPEPMVKNMMKMAQGGAKAMKKRLDAEIASIDRKLFKLNR
jgi:hypothetical protein